MKLHKISRGYNIPIKGKAERRIEEFGGTGVMGISPLEFRTVKPRLHAKLNDTVSAGSILFEDKRDPRIKFASPAAGRITDIQYGPRRVIERISIAVSGDDVEQKRTYRSDEIRSIDRADLIEHLLENGIWPFLRQRPFNNIPDPDSTPSSIFVNCMDTAPLATDPEFALQGKFAEFKAGIEALKVLCRDVHVVVDANNKDSEFLKVDGVTHHGFQGKHPAGLLSTHISRIDPLGPGKKVWYVNAREAVSIGSFLLLGQFPTERIISIAGPGLKEDQRFYLKTKAGVEIGAVLADKLADGEMRMISGNVLTGRKVGEKDFLGVYDDLITVVPEGKHRRFIGWLLPGFTRWTWSRTYMSSLLPGKTFAMDTNTNGEERAFVKTGDYEKVLALDIIPDFLAKAIMAEDIDLMEQLGIYEVDPEDFALCSYICPSKIEFTEIIRDGLELMEKETA